MNIRDADIIDVEQMSAITKELTAAGKRKSPDDEDFVRTHDIDDPNKGRCSVAEEDGVVLGFQSLTRARVGNPYGVEPGWGIIGTHIRPSAARRGVGRALFEVSRRSARAASIAHIDANIAADNVEALAYYEAMGFQTYRTSEGLSGDNNSGRVRMTDRILKELSHNFYDDLALIRRQGGLNAIDIKPKSRVGHLHQGS